MMFLGWNPGTEKEIYSLEEFVKDFSIEKIQTSEMAAFDRQKLLWFNGMYIRNMSAEDLWGRVVKWHEEYLEKLDLDKYGKEFNLKSFSL